MSGTSNLDGGRTSAQYDPDLVQSTHDQLQRLSTAGSQAQNDDWKEKYREMNQTMLLEKLVQATKYKDKKRLEKSIKAYRGSGPDTEDCDELEDAEKLLDILDTKQALIDATMTRDEEEIRSLIVTIEDKEKTVKKKCKDKKKTFKIEDGYKHHLAYEIGEARKVMRVVASGRSKNRQREPKSLKMDRNTMSEVKRYANPPVGLHPVMQASLLLLGEDEETTEKWGTCAKMANPDGRQGLNRRIQTFDIDELEPEICCRAKEILDELDYKKLRTASAGGAAFYVWAMGTVDEYMNTHSLEGVAPANIEQQKVLLGKVDPSQPADQPMFIPVINKHRGQARINSKPGPNPSQKEAKE